MSSDLAISVRSLSKTYRIFDHSGDRFKQALTLGRMSFHRKFTALKDVSFDIKKGETVGVIGSNGSGKSTLLQLLCGILKPSSGSVDVSGRVSALLELGAGFNPEFTGRENVYFQGALMGFTAHEMDSRFDDISAFADIGEFINQPVRLYSSGMFVRLAFSTMIHVDSDVLVIDEALAVGDEIFQRKCLERLGRYLGEGKGTLLFVSHNVRQVERLCSRVIWLEGGQVIQDGLSGEVCSAYQEVANRKLLDRHSVDRVRPNISYTGELDVLRLRLFQGQQEGAVNQVEMHSSVRFVIDFRCTVPLRSLDVVIRIHTLDSIFIAAASTAGGIDAKDYCVGDHRVECCVSDLILLPGAYQVRLGFIDRQLRPVWVGHGVCTFHVVGSPGLNLMRVPAGLVDIASEWVFESPVDGL